jgi:hypothetical protein
MFGVVQTYLGSLYTFTSGFKATKVTYTRPVGIYILRGNITMITKYQCS